MTFKLLFISVGTIGTWKTILFICVSFIVKWKLPSLLCLSWMNSAPHNPPFSTPKPVLSHHWSLLYVTHNIILSTEPQFCIVLPLFCLDSPQRTVAVIGKAACPPSAISHLSTVDSRKGFSHLSLTHQSPNGCMITTICSQQMKWTFPFMPEDAKACWRFVVS